MDDKAIRAAMLTAKNVKPVAAAGFDSAAQNIADYVAELLREGRASEVTNDLMAQADPQRLWMHYKNGNTGMDLPMDKDSRMARAAQMGLTEDTIHGTLTSKDFKSFKGEGRLGQENYVAPNTEDGRKLAAQFSTADQGRILPLRTPKPMDTRNLDDRLRFEQMMDDKNRLDDFRMKGGYRASGLPGWGDQWAIDTANEAGEKALRLHERDWVDSTAVFDPRNMRSQFARFDPRLSHLSDLNAATGGAILDKRHHQEAVERAQGQIAPSKYLPGVPRQVHADGGRALPKGYTIHVDKDRFGVLGKYNGANVAQLTLSRDPDTGAVSAFQMAVHPKHQRKGLMSAMHDAAEAAFGPMQPDKTLTEDGFAFWKGYRPDAVSNRLRFYQDSLMGKPVNTPYGMGRVKSVGDRGMTAELDGKDGATAYASARDNADMLRANGVDPDKITFANGGVADDDNQPIDLGAAREQKQLQAYHTGMMGNISDAMSERMEAHQKAIDAGVFDGYEMGDVLQGSAHPMRITGRFIRPWKPSRTVLQHFDRMGAKPTIIEHNGKQYIPMLRYQTGVEGQDGWQEGDAYLDGVKAAGYRKMGGLRAVKADGGSLDDLPHWSEGTMSSEDAAFRLKDASAHPGVDMQLMPLRPGQYSHDGEEHDGPEVWIEWLKRHDAAPKGAAALAMSKLTSAADHTNSVLRLEPDQNNPALIKYYKKFGFEEDPSGGEIMERTPRLSMKRQGFADGGSVAERSPMFEGMSEHLMDDDGKPMELWHGTPGQPFEAFDDKKIGVRDPGFYGRGHYLTPDWGGAEAYADPDEMGRGSVMGPLHAALKNPYVWDVSDENKAHRTLRDLQSMGIMRGQGKLESWDNLQRHHIDPFMAEMKRRGHDGVIYKTHRGPQEIVVFNPNMIKHRDAEVGDPNDPRIMRKSGGAVDKALNLTRRK